MSWLCIEGLDRSGKSTVAEYYRSQGYKVVHMSAPDKKYFNPSYAGESYLEEIVRLYSKYDGQDVVFDRTIYGELIWPNIFGREALLNEEDIEYLGHMEHNNDASKILMYDPNIEAHWKRCVENNEPLTRQQFGRANVFYERLVNEYGFTKKRLLDFPEISVPGSGSADGSGEDSISRDVGSAHRHAGDNDTVGSSNESSKVGDGNTNKVSDGQSSSSILGVSEQTIEQKLARANAIRSLLQGAIIKKKDDAYADIEQDIRKFLQAELDSIFKPKKLETSLSADEIAILKALAKRVQEKAK